MAAPAFTVIIPARLASSRLPDKPLADIAGRPMVVRVAERAALSAASRVVVATDHERIAEACTRFGVSSVMTRTDHASGSDRLAQACELLGLADSELVVNVQGDEPLIEPELIDAVASALAHHPEADMSTAAHPIETAEEHRNPHVVKVVVDAAGLAHYFSRAPIPHARDATTSPWWRADTPARARPLRHVGIYAYRVAFLRRFPGLAVSPLEQIEALEQLRALWHGHRIVVHLAESAPGPGVDTPADLERVRAIWAQQA